MKCFTNFTDLILSAHHDLPIWLQLLVLVALLAFLRIAPPLMWDFFKPAKKGPQIKKAILFLAIPVEPNSFLFQLSIIVFIAAAIWLIYYFFKSAKSPVEDDLQYWIDFAMVNYDIKIEDITSPANLKHQIFHVDSPANFDCVTLFFSHVDQKFKIHVNGPFFTVFEGRKLSKQVGHLIALAEKLNLSFQQRQYIKYGPAISH